MPISQTPSPDDTPLPAALRGLLRPEAYPHPVETIRVIETHMSWVLLTGALAYKIKRPVQFAFADFRDPDHRAHLCREEIRLNRRFAPELYLEVLPIRSNDGQASFVGDGATIESAVCMRQFDRSAELDRLVRAAAVNGDELEAFGAALAAIHAKLPRRAPSSRRAGHRQVARVIRRNFAEALALATAAGTSGPMRNLRWPLARLLRRSRPMLDVRDAGGQVRECHGDLHLSNVVRLDGRLTPFDALEFEPAFRWIDVADEVAFLCADLRGYGRPDLAAAFLGGYLDHGGDFQLLRVLALYMAHRALVRAKIMAIRAAGTTDAAQRSVALARQSEYLDVARHALAPRTPRLLLMHGVSGSGKTWLARQLARRLPAVHLRSDLERKRLAGLAPLAASGSPPGAGLYTEANDDRTYLRMEAAVRDALTGSQTVICDATFLARTRRAAFRRVADELGARTLLLHCTAPENELHARLRSRRSAGGDPSEADEVVLHRQQRHADPLQPEEDIEVIELDTSTPDPLAAALSQLAPRGLAEAS